MLEVLKGWVCESDGEAQVSVRLTNASGFTPYILRAVDEGGIVVSPMERPKEVIAYPWPSVYGITDARVVQMAAG